MGLGDSAQPGKQNKNTLVNRSLISTINILYKTNTQNLRIGMFWEKMLQISHSAFLSPSRLAVECQTASCKFPYPNLLLYNVDTIIT